MNGKSKYVDDYPFLDLLRSIACFLVLAGHAKMWFFTTIEHAPQPSIFLKIFWFVTDLQHQSVVIFFVMSGFLVGGGIYESFSNRKFYIFYYILNRFSRIFVVYYPALFLTGVLFVFGHLFFRDFGVETIRPLFLEYAPGFGGTNSFFCHMAGVQGFMCAAWSQNPALWSLGYEWVLYLFAPALIGLCVAVKAPAWRIAGLFLVLSVAAAMSVDLKESAFWFGAWFSGVAASRLLKANVVSWPVAMAGVVFLLIGLISSRLGFVHVMTGDVMIAIGTALMVSCRPIVAWRCLPQFFSWTAGFSYSLYATHLPVIFFTIAALQNSGFPRTRSIPGPIAFFQFGVCVAVSILVGYAVSIFTERQTRRVRSWIRQACTPTQLLAKSDLHH